MQRNTQRNTKKLWLNRETLRNLQDGELRYVVGGGDTDKTSRIFHDSESPRFVTRILLGRECYTDYPCVYDPCHNLNDVADLSRVCDGP